MRKGMLFISIILIFCSFGYASSNLILTTSTTTVNWGQGHASDPASCQSITIPSDYENIYNISLEVNVKQTNSPSGSCNYTMRNMTDKTTILYTTDGYDCSGTGWKRFNFGTEMLLIGNTQYLFCPSSITSGTTTIYMSNVNDNPYNGGQWYDDDGSSGYPNMDVSMKIYGDNYTGVTSSDIIVLNDSLKFTSDDEQSCGFNGSDYIDCGPTEDGTPTFTFNTTGNADCKIWNESLNWTTLENQGVFNCSTTGTTEHVCTFPEPLELRDAKHELFISCKSGTDEMNEFIDANRFNITINKVTISNDVLEEGIKISIPDATIYSNQQIYVIDGDNQQDLATFDKVASYGDQRWAINYITIGQEYSHMFNLSPSFYVLELTGLTNSSIKTKVSEFINNTKN